MNNSISLRTLKEKDAPLMLEWMSDPEIACHFRFELETVSMDSVNEFISNSQIVGINANYAIVDEYDEYLGTISLKNIDHNAKSAEYAISLRKKAQGCGYGYSATKKILEYAFFTLNLQRVYLNVFSENAVAIRFYEKFGFVFEGEFLGHIFAHNRIHSLKWYRLMKYEYEEMKASEK